MKQEDVVASDVLLSYPINAKNREGHNETLETVGDAAGFLLTNFSRDRSADVDWRVAASALEQAAESDITEHATYATKAVIMLLEAEKLIRR